jgi:hypothetical protein
MDMADEGLCKRMVKILLTYMLKFRVYFSYNYL